MFGGTVFVGKAVRSQPVPAQMLVRTTFDVSEVLNGTILTKTVDVQSASEGSMCGTSFTVGTTYVVYAGGDPKLGLSTGMCSRTHVLQKNDEDVAFARASAKSTATKAKVVGMVTVSGEPNKRRAGIEVRVKGTTIAAKTNAKGEFTFDLAPGTYELEVNAPGLRPWQGEKLPLQFPNAKVCPRPRITLAWDGQIQGRVSYADGSPASGARISAMARPGTEQQWRIESTALADGSYTLHEVQAGQWSVVVSSPDDGYPSPVSPHPTTFYPGTPDAKQAKAIAIKRAGLVKGIDFVVPAPMPVVTITGDVKRADGSAAVKAWITVTPKGGNRSTGGSTDDRGALSVQELVGDVVVRACQFDDNKNCIEVPVKVDPAMKRLAITLPK